MTLSSQMELLQHLEKLSLGQDVGQLIELYEPHVETAKNDENLRQKMESFKPFINIQTARGLYNLGEFLLHDDRFDIGYLAYRNRLHYYNGKWERHHPSTNHHWPAGIALCVAGGILGAIADLMDLKNDLMNNSNDNDNDNYNDNDET